MRPAPRRRGGELDGHEPRQDSIGPTCLLPRPSPKAATVSAQVLAKSARVCPPGGPAAGCA